MIYSSTMNERDIWCLFRIWLCALVPCFTSNSVGYIFMYYLLCANFVKYLISPGRKCSVYNGDDGSKTISTPLLPNTDSKRYRFLRRRHGNRVLPQQSISRFAKGDKTINPARVVGGRVVLLLYVVRPEIYHYCCVDRYNNLPIYLASWWWPLVFVTFRAVVEYLYHVITTSIRNRTHLYTPTHQNYSVRIALNARTTKKLFF